MKAIKPAVLKEITLNDYILVFKYLMKEAGAKHTSGFVNAPLLFAKYQGAELQKYIDDAVKHGVILKEGEKATINDVVYTFINAWIHSKNVVNIKKPSFTDGKGIFAARVKGMYLMVLQDVSKDMAILAADEQIEVLYDFFADEIEKKDPNKKFKLKKANKELAEKGSHFQLEVDPVNLVFLQTQDNGTGTKYERDELIHVGKKRLEEISLNNQQLIVNVASRDSGELKDVIVNYIKTGLPEQDRPLKKTGGNKSSEKSTGKSNDPEYYTRLSFAKLTENEKFPKGFFGFLGMMFISFIKSFINWKNLLKRAGIMALMAGLAFLWNVYALCYLNDTFHITEYAIFGKSTPFLLAGTASEGSVMGVPGFIGFMKTVSITLVLYYLLSLAIRTFVSDVATGKIKRNFAHFFSFGNSLKDYRGVVSRSMSFYIWTGLAVAAVLNIILFNPYTVALLGIMVLLSCMKCEDGAVAPILMMFSSSVRYKRVMSGNGKIPLFGDIQLRLFGIGTGLMICTVLNCIVWILLDFNFWVRLAITVVIIVITLFQIGILKVNKGTATAILGAISFAAGLMYVLSAQIIVLADDGGWSESGSSIAGLLQNSGWPTILAFSLTLAGAAGFACLTFGLGTALIAAGAAFGTSAIWASVSETGRKTAYDFVWGNYSKYGGDSPIAAALSFAVSLVPGFGDAFGVVTGIRDCSYDIGEGDWASLALDALGLGMDCYGLASDVGDLFKHSDELADAAGSLLKNADEVGDVLKHGDDVAESLLKHGDEAVESMIKQGDEAVESMIKHGDEVVDSMIKQGDEAVESMIKHGDEAVESMVKHGDEVVESTIKHGDEAAETVIKHGDEATETIIKHGDEGAEAVTKHGDEVTEAVVKKEDEIVEAVTKKEDEIAEAVAKKEDEIAEAVAKKEDEIAEAVAKKEDEMAEAVAKKEDEIAEAVAKDEDEIAEAVAKDEDEISEAVAKDEEIITQEKIRRDRVSEEFGKDVPQDYIDKNSEVYDRYFQLKDEGLSHSEINERLINERLDKEVAENEWFDLKNKNAILHDLDTACGNAKAMDPSVTDELFYDIKNGLVPYEPEKQFPNAYKEFAERFDGNKPVACIISNDDYYNIKTSEAWAGGLGRAAMDGKDSAHFVITDYDAKDIFENSDNLMDLAHKLGLEDKKYIEHGGARLVIIQPSAIDNIRYSTRETQGANLWWIPGLRTSGGQFEAVISRIENVLTRDDVTISKLLK